MRTRSRPLFPSELYRRWRSSSPYRTRNNIFASAFRILHSALDYRLALIVWLILGVAVSIRTLVSPCHHTVFPIFAGSAEHWWGNCPLYDLYPGLDRFRYPPVFALFVTPFSVLGLTAGGILWSWLSIAVFVAGLWQYLRDVVPSAWTRQRKAAFLILGGLGALRGLWNAQSNALIAGLLLLGAAALARVLNFDFPRPRSRTQAPELSTPNLGWWLAAALLAVPVCLKLTPLAPVVLLAALWPRRLAWRLLVVVAGLSLLPFLTRPTDFVLEQYRGWIDHLLGTGNIRWIGFRDSWTVWIVLHHILGGESGSLSLCEPMDSSWYQRIQLATATAALGWCLWQRYRAGRRGLRPRWLIHVTLSMGLGWLMLFGPAVEHATYVFLAPPLLWALLENRAWPHGRGLIWTSFTLIMVLGWGAVTRLLAPDWPIVLTALPAGTALFVLWLIGYAQNCGTEMPKERSKSEPRFATHSHLLPYCERWNETTITP